MPQRWHHYECAIESHLRDRRIAYVSVDQARRALDEHPGGTPTLSARGLGDAAACALKSFDFVLYGAARHWLIDVKGRKVCAPARAGAGALATGRLESWATRDDVDSLRRWRDLFGEGFDAVFLFAYWCEAQPPHGLFEDLTEYQGRWYALRAIALDDYAAAMKTRSTRWRTVDIPADRFARLSRPFAEAWAAAASDGRTTGVYAA